MRWIILLALLSLTAQAAEWVRFKPCGFAYPKGGLHFRTVEPEQLLEIYIHVPSVLAIYNWKGFAENKLDCTMIVLVGNREIIVAEPYEKVIKKLKSED